ncbi:hypothetical protein C2S52_001471 [Perilla frutescens var. hirtella]|nr:hypothetical protein C2S52_001471 [Perilla frutescens var. hirtella]
MCSRGTRADKGKGKVIAEGSDHPRHRHRTHSGLHISDSSDMTSAWQQQPHQEYDHEGRATVELQSQESRAVGGDDFQMEESEEEIPSELRGSTLKSALFTVHFRKVPKRGEEGVFDLYCNYCPKQYKFCTGGGYGTYWAHINSHHQVELGRAQAQSELNFQPISSANVESQGGESLALQFADSMNFECRMKATYNPGAQRIHRP